MTITYSFVALLALVFFWFFARRVAVKRPFDLIDLVLYYFFLAFIARPAMLIFRVDTPWLDVVSTAELDSVIAFALLLCSIWISLLAVSSNIGYRIAGKSWFYRPGDGFSEKEMLRASIGLLLLGSVMLIPAILSAGGFANFQYLSKISDEDVEKSFRIPIVLSVLFATAAIVHMRWKKQRVGSISASEKKTLILSASVVIIGGGLSFAYGARDSIVFSVVTILLAPFVGRQVTTKQLTKLLLILCVVLVTASAARFVRDQNIMGNSAVFNSEETIARKITVATNLTKFDSFMVVVRDVPDRIQPLGVLPFIESLRTLPFGEIILGPDDPAFQNIAIETIRWYIPWRRNGSPVTAIGDWYVSFTWAGLIIGALISGILLGWVQKKMAGFVVNPLIFCFSIYIAARLLAYGIWAKSPTTVFRFAVPVILVVSFMYLLRTLFNGKSKINRAK